MLKKITLSALACCAALAALAQQPLATRDMVAVSPMVPVGVDLPSDAKSSLNVKLSQLAVQNGFGSLSNQFALTADVVMIDKQATGTAPVQFLTKLEVTFFLVDLIEGVAMGEASVTVQGVDRLENKAIIQAINQIKPKSPALQSFMTTCRERLLDYYTTRLPAIMDKARSLAARDQYADALELLAAVPEYLDQYPAVADQMTAIYLKMADAQADAALARAKGLIAVRDYGNALDALQLVSPSSSRAKQDEALKLIDGMKTQVDADLLRDYEDARKDKADALELEKMRINAAREIGLEQAKAQTSLADKLNDWYLARYSSK